MILSQLEADRYIWDGSLQVFEITFEVKTDADGAKYIRVQWVDSLGNTTVGQQGVHYTVSGLGVTMKALSNPSPGGYTVVISRDTDITQEVQLLRNGVTDLHTLERMSDKLTMIVQELLHLQERTLRRPITDENEWGELPAEDTRAGRLLSFNSAGNPIAVTGVTGIPTTEWAEGLLEQMTAEEARDYIGAAGDLEPQLYYQGIKTITESVTLGTEVNWMTIGPITIDPLVEVTVEGEWVIV